MRRSLLPRHVLLLLLLLSTSTCRSSEDEASPSSEERPAFRSALTFSPAGIREAATDSRCVGVMGRINPEWDDRDLRHMCSWGADTSCLACWASNHPDASPSNILDNCLPDENGDDSDLQDNGCYNGPGFDYDGPYTPPPSPPRPPTFPNNPDYGRNCGGRLAELRPNWSPSQLNSACSGADAECVVSTARQRPNWSPGQLNAACSGEGQPQPAPVPPYFPHNPNVGRNCGGRLAELRPNWSPGQLSSACSGADAECVVSTARQRPNWSPSQLNAACSGGGQPQPAPVPPYFPQDPNVGRNCGGRLAELRPNWSPGQLSSACSGADAECVVSTARQRPNWSPGQLNAACSGR